MKQITSGLHTYKQIQELGGFEEITKQGFNYYELYHQCSNGDFEGHNLYEIYEEQKGKSQKDEIKEEHYGQHVKKGISYCKDCEDYLY